jgi:hypothetical protein
VGDILAINRNRAKIGLNEAHDHVKAGCFARAIGTEQAQHLPPPQTQRDTIHNGSPLKGLAKIMRDEAILIIGARLLFGPRRFHVLCVVYGHFIPSIELTAI